MKKTTPNIDPDDIFADEDDDLDEALASCAAPEGGPSTAKGRGGNRWTRARNGVSGFVTAPVWVLTELGRARAYHAAVLVMILLQRMRMRGTTTEPVTASVWNKAGSPSKWERQTILEHLRRVPGILKLEERHKGYTRYQVTLGEMWNEPL
jgi:hypothetical protein